MTDYGVRAFLTIMSLVLVAVIALGIVLAVQGGQRKDACQAHGGVLVRTYSLHAVCISRKVVIG